MKAVKRDDQKTVFQPSETPAPASDGAAQALRAGGLPEGTLLNNIYRVSRFLARGGMGEVYQGTNVNTDERVAIKVMLPHLAADPKIQAMFRKEARILTELAHPALVRYRVLAQEPQLGLFYIVTEFIDGQSISDILGKVKPSDAELKALIRRLAEGLSAAHAAGAIHRDMSPDNVLLPQGRLDQAKIIDFGIARESAVAHQTVVGDSFAGKLGYVAPEQFGDFGRNVGPWTDVYSLGLVVLALAAGRAPDMGATLVDAVDRRREGVDLSPVVGALKPILEKMLAPDPAHRFQTMRAVIEALDGPATADLSEAQPRPVSPPATPEAAAAKPPPKSWLYGAGALAVLLAAGAGLALTMGGGGKAPPVETPIAATPIPSAPEPQDATPLVELPRARTSPPAVPVVQASTTVKTAPAAKPVAPQPPPEAPVVAITPRVAERPPTPAPRTAAIDAFAAPGRPTVQAEPSAPPAPTASAAPSLEKGMEACWRAADGGWKFAGYASRQGCVGQVFGAGASACQVVHGRWGAQQLRRYDGKIEIKGTGALARWKTVGPSECPAVPAAR